MSLKRNILASYVSQIYVTLLGIVMVPVYLNYMGAEAYGLVGFFIMLQVWFNMLDMGLTPTLSRETSRFSAGATDALSLRRLLRAMEGLFAGVGILGASAMVVGAEAIARSWLKVQQLPVLEVHQAISLMAGIVALRWASGLYRGALSGFERLVWLSGFNVVMATARFILVIPFFIYVGTRPSLFFSYQLALAVIEIVVLVIYTYRVLPKTVEAVRTPWVWAPLRTVLRFSLSIAFTSSVWVLVTQTDKLVLSKLLPLAEYGYFTLAVLVASGVAVISGPISAALLPRMARLSAEGQEASLVHLYRSATQLVAIIALSASWMLACLADQVLWAWTGDLDVVRQAAPVLTLYAVGNGILTLSAFPYYMQFAKGDLKLHTTGSLIFLFVLIPVLVGATLEFGVIGAGWAWLVTNVIYFVTWVPRVHHKFLKGLHWDWFRQDVLGIAVLALIVPVVVWRFFQWPVDRMGVVAWTVLFSVVSVVVTATGSSVVRHKMKNKLAAYWR